MKRLLTTALVGCFVAALTFSAKGGEAPNDTSPDIEPLIACTWFPICREPDFGINHSNEPAEDMDTFEVSDDMLACTWFPICRDPDGLTLS